MRRKLAISLSGNPDGPIATALGDLAEVRRYDPAGPFDGFDVLLIDSGGEGGLDDPDQLEALLSAGKSVGWVDPDPDVLDIVADAFGVRVEREPGLLIIARTSHAGAIWRRIERAGGLPEQLCGVAVVREDGLVETADPQPRPLSEQEAARLIAAAAARDWKATLPAADSALIPPVGAVWSGFELSGTASWAIPISGWDYGGRNPQTATWSYVAHCYVYYANGNGGNRYNLISLARFTSNPGKLEANATAARNWFQAQVLPGVRLATLPANRATSLVHSPPSSIAPDPAVEKVSVPMTFQIQGVPVAWTASYENVYATPGWGLIDQTDVATSLTQWEYYQTSVWNPLQYPITDFNSWQAMVFDENHHVCALPTASTNPYNIEVASGWSVAGNPGNAGPLDATLEFSLASGLYGFATSYGAGGGARGARCVYLVGNGAPTLAGRAWITRIDLVSHAELAAPEPTFERTER